jgi:signal transduction histidine kinase
MIEGIAESPAIAWPMALTLASVVVADRVRLARRRSALNRCLHELRRPLQALALCGSRRDPITGGQLGCAIEALAGLDRQINGGAPPPRRLIDLRALAEQAVERWRGPAIRAGSQLGFAWRTGRAEVLCDPEAVSRALDNLIANAIEHGAGPVRVEGSSRPGCVRVHVSNRAAPATVRMTTRAPFRLAGDPRRGHGLRIVRSVAAEHGGRFAACRHRDGASAVLELPLARA